MEHEEAEMQDIMDNFIKNELERQKSKIIAIAKDSGNIYELVKRINLLK
jgi:aminopeptidase N